MTAPPEAPDRRIHGLLAPFAAPLRFEPSDEVVRGELIALLEAARWAPSTRNRQPWRFLVGRRGDSTYTRLRGALTTANRVRAQGAGAFVLAVNEARDSAGEPLAGTEYELGLAVGRMIVQARALGRHTMQFGGFDRARLRVEFGIPPQFDPFVIVAVGAGVRMPPGGTDGRAARLRRALAELAFTGRWGQPAVG